MIVIDLPWPHPHLSPNARVHWSKLARAKAAQRTLAHWMAYKAYRAFGSPQLIGPVDVHCEFAPPDKRRRDMDNMLASIKAALDGVSAVIGVDDSKWRLSMHVAPPVKDGRVRVIVRPALVSIPIVGTINGGKDE
jgi:Holliday junction resolvase RusA-like endonuclease